MKVKVKVKVNIEYLTDGVGTARWQGLLSFGMADEPLKAGWKMAAVRSSTLVSVVRQVPD